MRSTIKSRFKPSVEPMNRIYISKSALLYNYNYLQSLKPQAVLFPVLKSNAYGHGIDQMLEVYKGLNIPYVVVDSFPEYNIVHRHSKFNILLLGETLPVNYRVFDFKRTTFCVYNLETLKVLAKMDKKVTIHLFLNTGMNREGIDVDLLQNALEFLRNYPKIQVEGVLSHLHSADKLSIQSQIEAFKMMYSQILDYGHTPKYRHIGASTGILKIQDDFFNAYRPGLVLYGYNPLSEEDSDFELGEKLKPALTLTSVITAINSVSYNEGVSYEPQWKQLEKIDKITVTIPFGYAEGFLRVCRDKIKIRHKDKYVSQIGAICMNMSCYLGTEKMLIGDKVYIVDEDKKSECSLGVLAKSSGTCIYEILVRLDKGIRREVIK